MRIALIIRKLDAGGGGAERVCATLASGLARRGHAVEVLAASAGPVPDGIVWRRVEGDKHRSFAEGAARISEGYDVVHSFTRTVRQDIFRLGGGTHIEYLRRTDAERGPLASWWRRLNPKERTILDLEREAMKNSRLIQAVSRRTAQEARDHYGVTDDRLAVLHNGVDTEFFHPRNVGRSRDRIRAELELKGEVALFAGSGFRRKGLRTAIEAVAALPRWSLVVMGRDEPDPWREECRRLGCERRVRFIGPRSDPQDLYASADVLVLPSLYDPFPNVCLEAMATGVPVITTPVTGVAEILTHGVDGFVAEGEEEIAAALPAIPDPGMGAAARATAERYGLEWYVDETLALYGRLAV